VLGVALVVMLVEPADSYSLELSLSILVGVASVQRR